MARYTSLMDELIIGEKAYIPSKKAAEITGYAKDYIGQLCREGRVEAKLVGRSWYVLESSIREHRFGPGVVAEAIITAPVAPVEEVLSPVDESPVTNTWESPTYTPELVEEVVPVIKTTSLENTPHFSEPKVADLQSSWETWFSKPADQSGVTSETFEATEKDEVVEEYPEEEMEEAPVIEEEPRTMHHEVPSGAHVLTITPIRPEATRMVQEEVYVPRPQPVAAYAHRTRAKAKRREVRRSKGTGLIARAVFVAFVMLVVAVAVVGTGFFDGVSSHTQFASPIIDFIGGVERAHK